jgi:hypothetical protein
LVYEINKPEDADKNIACFAKADKKEGDLAGYKKAKENLEYEAKASIKNASEDKVVETFDKYVAMEDQIDNKYLGLDFTKIRGTKYASPELKELYISKILNGGGGEDIGMIVTEGVNFLISKPEAFFDGPRSKLLHKVIRESTYAKYFNKRLKEEIAGQEKGEMKITLINQALKEKPFPVEPVHDVVSHITQATDGVKKIAQGYYGIKEPINEIRIEDSSSAMADAVDLDSAEYVIKLSLDDIKKKYPSLTPGNLKSFEEILTKAKASAEIVKKYFPLYQQYVDSVKNVNALLGKNGIPLYDDKRFEYNVDGISNTLKDAQMMNAMYSK